MPLPPAVPFYTADDLRFLGKSEAEIADILFEQQIGAMSPSDMPMGIAGNDPIIDEPITGGIDVGFTRDSNGNPIIDTGNIIAAEPIFAPQQPSPEYQQQLANNFQEQPAPQQPAPQVTQAPVVQQVAQQAAQQNGMGGPDSPVDNSMYDPFGSFMAGAAGAQAAPYSGGLQQFAAIMAGGSANMHRDMAEARDGMSKKMGKTPIYMDTPNGMKLGVIDGDGNWHESKTPEGYQALKPTTWLNTGTGHLPVGYGQQMPSQGAQQVTIQPPPETAPEYRGQQALETGRGKSLSELESAYPTAVGGMKALRSDVKRMSGWIDDAIDLSQGKAGGWFDVLGGMPGTDAMAFRNKMESLRDAVATGNLIDIKAQGGSFGALSDEELRLLGNKYGSLATMQDQALIRKTLREMKQMLREGEQRRIGTHNATYEDVPKFEKWNPSAQPKKATNPYGIPEDEWDSTTGMPTWANGDVAAWESFKTSRGLK